MPPRRERKRPRARVGWNAEARQAAAERVVYRGSPEHKTSPSFAGAFRPRVGNSTCPPRLLEQRELLTQWLREAVLADRVAGPLESGFPRYAWVFQQEQWFQARLTNATHGEYKGWPVDEEEVPDWLRTPLG